MTESVECVLAIDPGSVKCGLAVVRRAESGDLDTVHRAVLGREDLSEAVNEAASRFSPDVILVGDGTLCREYRLEVEKLGAAPVEVVDEKFTTLRARRLYFDQHPPRGLRRLIPTSMQTPPCPYDDLVAVILAQSYLSRQGP